MSTWIRDIVTALQGDALITVFTTQIVPRNLYTTNGTVTQRDLQYRNCLLMLLSTDILGWPIIDT
jgi:hypothetical protein